MKIPKELYEENQRIQTALRRKGRLKGVLKVFLYVASFAGLIATYGVAKSFGDNLTGETDSTLGYVFGTATFILLLLLIGSIKKLDKWLDS